MANLQNSLSKKDWVIVGVSGGPDSMALLDMLNRQNKFNLVAVHVNYQMRESALRDQDLTKRYCRAHNIPCIVYEAPDLSQGNFQKNARDFRFLAFKEVYIAYQAVTLFLAHHKDDHLETIVFQLLSSRTPETLGIRPLSKFLGMLIKRPLLNKTKAELIEYCQQHQIDYGIDESNTETIYTRNLIRQKLETFTEEDKEKLLMYQRVYGKRRRIVSKRTKKFLNENKNMIPIDDYQREEEVVRLAIIRELFKRQQLSIENLTKKYCQDLDEKILSQVHQRNRLNQDKQFVIEYGTAYIVDLKDKDYAVMVNELKAVKHTHFNLNFREGTGVMVYDSDFPLTIRNATHDDKILLRFGSKKLNRFFIDRKIPYRDRLSWPVIENAQNKVICVVELGCDVDHYQQPYNLFIKRGKI